MTLEIEAYHSLPVRMLPYGDAKAHQPAAPWPWTPKSSCCWTTDRQPEQHETEDMARFITSTS